jgi:hypothetical protein
MGLFSACLLANKAPPRGADPDRVDAPPAPEAEGCAISCPLVLLDTSLVGAEEAAAAGALAAACVAGLPARVAKLLSGADPWGFGAKRRRRRRLRGTGMHCPATAWGSLRGGAVHSLPGLNPHRTTKDPPPKHRPLTNE